MYFKSEGLDSDFSKLNAAQTWEKTGLSWKNG
jgi:hypothetical protein